MRIAIISANVGRNPDKIFLSFVFDEIKNIKIKKGLDVHVIRTKKGKDSRFYGIFFHDISESYPTLLLNNCDILRKYINIFSPIILAENPKIIIYELLYSSHIIETIKKLKTVEIIHAHFAYPEGFCATLAKEKIKKPLIVTLHGRDILMEPSTAYGIRLKKRYNLIVQKVLQYADAIIVASHAVYREVMKIVNNTNKVYVIPNGVDLKRFNPMINGDNIRRRFNIGNKFVVFSLRSHEPIYGLEYLIRAVPLIVEKKRDVVFIIGGDGSLRRYHEQLATRLGVRDKIIFTGFIPRNEVPYYYAASDVIVVPSIQEAFGLVVTEAMASGKPVIGTNVGGIPDQIIDGYNGFLVPSRDPDAIAEKILWFAEHPQQANQMGMNGRKIAEERFDLSKRIDAIVELYKKFTES